jgi:hypothetical protein
VKDNLDNFWDIKEEEYEPNDRYERTAENEYDSEEKRSPNILSDEEAEKIRLRYGRVEREFEATFSYAYNNCRETRHSGVKIILATTPTVDQGVDEVKTKLLRSYPNIDINSIIYKED